MSYILIIKVISAILLILSGGLIFTEYGRRNRFISISAASLGVLASVYVIMDVKDDIYYLNNIDNKA